MTSARGGNVVAENVQGDLYPFRYSPATTLDNSYLHMQLKTICLGVHMNTAQLYYSIDPRHVVTR